MSVQYDVLLDLNSSAFCIGNYALLLYFVFTKVVIMLVIQLSPVVQLYVQLYAISNAYSSYF